MTIKALRYLTAILLATLIAGCGLQEYESRMRATQERVSKYTEEMDALGEPVAIPTKIVVIGGTTADPKAAKPAAKDAKTPPAKEQKSTTPTTERKKIIVGTYGKDQTPEERAQAEFEFLSKGGADYSGQQAFREAMRRLGR